MTDETAPGHILLVEDDGDIRELLCRQLARMGYAVTQAATAGECLSRLRSEGGSRLDLVLLDLHLPDSNGREVIENMRADPRILRLPVVVLSCDRSAESVAELLASGAVDYLVKPWRERELEARMASAIRESRQKETLLRTQQVLARVKNELQLIFDAVSESVMLVAADMTIRRINRAGLALSGRSSYDELLGHKCHQAIYGAAEPCADCPVAAAFREGRPQEREMVRHIAGRTLYRRQRAFPIDRPDGGEPLVAEVTEDVTQQRELKEQTVRAEKLQAVMRLAGALAHEISQPLSAASGRAELLEMSLGNGSPPAEPAELVRHIEGLRGSCRRISDIVHRLQGVSTYVTKPYYGTEEILDLEKASADDAADLPGKDAKGKEAGQP